MRYFCDMALVDIVLLAEFLGDFLHCLGVRGPFFCALGFAAPSVAAFRKFLVFPLQCGNLLILLFDSVLEGFFGLHEADVAGLEKVCVLFECLDVPALLHDAVVFRHLFGKRVLQRKGIGKAGIEVGAGGFAAGGLFGLCCRVVCGSLL